MLKTLNATRYVTPLREGGSLPAIVEAEDDGLYVLKFRGAGQGPKALIAELVAGELARTLGLRVPELVLMSLDPVLGRAEPDTEIRELIKASGGLNLALDYLPGSMMFDPIGGAAPSAAMASMTVWLDAYVTNPDRTPKNPNLLVWHREHWLIDHGAALYFHHAWDDFLTRSQTPFAPIRDHVLLPWASGLAAADAEARSRLTPEVLKEVVEKIPAEWLQGESPFSEEAAHRDGYLRYLQRRLEAAPLFVAEAERAHAPHV